MRPADPSRRPVPARKGWRRVRQPRAAAAAEPRGYYREYTVGTPGSRDRGARRIVCGGQHPAPRTPAITPQTTTPAFGGSCSEPPGSAAQLNFHELKEERDHALADSPSEHRAVDSRLSRERPGRPRARRRPAFPVCQPAAAQTKQDVLECIAQQFTVPGALRQELRRAVRLHDRPVHKSGPQPGFVVVLEQIPANPRSTRKRASSCSTSSATPPTTGRTGRYRSGASILFCSPLPGKRVMGAGDGSGPRRKRSRQAGQAGRQDRGQQQLRHEHAADEQRLRHGLGGSGVTF